MAQVVSQMKGMARHGRLVREECDHNHPNYNGLSNKSIKIAAARVLGRNTAGAETLSFDEAWSVIAKLAFG